VPTEKMDFHIKTGVGVSGRNFKKAVQRNKVKRLLREAYRTEKTPLHEHLSNSGKQVAVFILYIDKAEPVFAVIKDKMPLVIKRLVKELNENNTKNT